MWCHGSLNHGLFICWQLCDESTLVRVAADCWWRGRNECGTIEKWGQVFCHAQHPRQNQATSCLPDEWTGAKTWLQERRVNHIYGVLSYFVVVLNAEPSLCKTGRISEYKCTQSTETAQLHSMIPFTVKNEQSIDNIWSIIIVMIMLPCTKDWIHVCLSSPQDITFQKTSLVFCYIAQQTPTLLLLYAALIHFIEEIKKIKREKEQGTGSFKRQFYSESSGLFFLFGKWESLRLL